MPKNRHDIGVETSGFTAVVVKQDDDGWKFLLLQRAETETYGGSWGFVTGSKRGEETIAQAVAREVLEEIELIEELHTADPDFDGLAGDDEETGGDMQPLSQDAYSLDGEDDPPDLLDADDEL